MARRRASSELPADATWVDRLVSAEPRAPLLGPYMAYLLLLAFMDVVPPAGMPIAIVLHIAGAAWVIALFRGHYPPTGRWHVPLAVLAGLVAAWGWVAGEHALNGLTLGGFDLGGRLPVFPGETEPYNPHDDYGHGSLFGVYASLKIARACTVVPIVEEIFWRAFVLRLFIDFHRPETVPLGRFTWISMIGSSLLSTLQHPDNWMVSIGCWLFFNALFVWTRSLKCLMLTHAVTNLALYVYVIRAGDWQFW